MSDTIFGLIGLFILIFLLLATCTQRGTFEWTFDGQHHVLKTGNTK